MRLNKKVFLISAFCLLTSDLARGDYQAIDFTKSGTLQGVVKFPGEPPARAMFANQGDANCPRGIPQDHLIVKQENRGIQNAVVVLHIERGKPLPLRNGNLANKECRLIPRVQWAALQGTLVMTNADPAAHEVHAYHDGTSAFAVSLAAGKSQARRPLVMKGFYKINCDRHLWTRGWVYVADHPYVAVTDESGRFEMKDVPVGTYTIRAWHEGWMEKGTEPTGQPRLIAMQDERRVTVKKESVTEVLLDTLKPAILYPQ